MPTRFENLGIGGFFPEPFYNPGRSTDPRTGDFEDHDLHGEIDFDSHLLTGEVKNRLFELNREKQRLFLRNFTVAAHKNLDDAGLRWNDRSAEKILKETAKEVLIEILSGV